MRHEDGSFSMLYRTVMVPVLMVTIVLLLLQAVETIKTRSESRKSRTRTAVATVKTGASSANDISTSEELPTLPPGACDHERQTVEIFERVSPSVVSVANRGLVRGGFLGLTLYEMEQGAGSGFVWDQDGHIISNYHVIHQASSVSVTLRDGTSFDAKIVGADPDRDLAVLKIDAPRHLLVPVPVGSSHGLRVGQTALAIGNPFGLDTTLTMGIVSALGRTITSMTDRKISDVIQTDTAINPGNSGGPLLDSAGRLIGVTTAIVSPSGAYAGVGFAVPVDTVKRIVPQLIEFGRVRRAGMGVELLPDHITRRAGMRGAGILGVMPNGPASRAGLEGVVRQRDGLYFGDVIKEVAGIPITNTDDYASVMDEFKDGEVVEVVVERNGKRRRVEVTLREL